MRAHTSGPRALVAASLLLLAATLTACGGNPAAPDPATSPVQGAPPPPSLYAVSVSYDRIHVDGSCDPNGTPGELTYQATFWAETPSGSGQYQLQYAVGTSGYPAAPPIAISEEAWTANGNALLATQGGDITVNQVRAVNLAPGQGFKVQFNATEWDVPFLPIPDLRLNNSYSVADFKVSGTASLAPTAHLGSGACSVTLHYTITVHAV